MTGGMGNEKSPGRLRCSVHERELNASGQCASCAQMISPGPSVAMTVFTDGDDDGYRAWVAKHQGGYVINIQKTFNPTDARLHQANCGTINGDPAQGDVFVGDYVKVCGFRRTELDKWAVSELGAAVQQCQICF